jgi:histone H3/H4
MGGFAAHYALLAGRRTVLVDDVVFANARIKQEDFV